MSRITAFYAENFKKLVAVRITPRGNVIRIGGKNMQGKTSVLDALWLAIRGKTKEMALQTQLIRKGCEEAIIEVATDDPLYIRRTFKRGPDGEVTTKVVVSARLDGKGKFQQPQAVLDALYTRLCFDPSEFVNMSPKEQFEVCRQFVPNVDFEAIQRAHEADEATRLIVGRDRDREKHSAESITVPMGTPAEITPISNLTQELKEAGEENQQNTLRKSNRDKLVTEIETLQDALANFDEYLNEESLLSCARSHCYLTVRPSLTKDLSVRSTSLAAPGCAAVRADGSQPSRLCCGITARRS